MTAIAVCAITHSECYWRTVFYLIVDPTACMAHTSPQYEHHWPTTGWLCVIRSWAGSWHRLWTCPVCVLLTKGLWAAPDRIVNDLWYVVEMTAGLCVHLPHVFYVRFVRVWLLIAIRYGSWYCLQIAPFWLLSAIGLRYIYIYVWFEVEMSVDNACAIAHINSYLRAICEWHMIIIWADSWHCSCA